MEKKYQLQHSSCCRLSTRSLSVSKALISAKGIQTGVHVIKHACQLSLISFNGNDGACKQTFKRNNTI